MSWENWGLSALSLLLLSELPALPELSELPELPELPEPPELPEEPGLVGLPLCVKLPDTFVLAPLLAIMTLLLLPEMLTELPVVPLIVPFAKALIPLTVPFANADEPPTIRAWLDVRPCLRRSSVCL